jgi:hypothetical protein
MDTKYSSKMYLFPPIAVALFFGLLTAIIVYPRIIIMSIFIAIIGWRCTKNSPGERRKFLSAGVLGMMLAFLAMMGIAVIQSL